MTAATGQGSMGPIEEKSCRRYIMIKTAGTPGGAAVAIFTGRWKTKGGMVWIAGRGILISMTIQTSERGEVMLVNIWYPAAYPMTARADILRISF